MKMYTMNNCFIENQNDEFTGTLQAPKCKIPSPTSGCAIMAELENTYGSGFNNGNF
jgi:hypothetical protein